MSGQLPLQGLRVLDLASFIAGPVASTVMGDYGAEVIKIEPPGEGDPQRKLGQAHSIPQHPVNFCWHMTNRNKRSVVLDLKNPMGRQAFDRLVATADVMVVNFPLKVRERLRMRYADVKPANPRLIYAALTGYGEQGPDADQPGFDIKQSARGIDWESHGNVNGVGVSYYDDARAWNDPLFRDFWYLDAKLETADAAPTKVWPQTATDRELLEYIAEQLGPGHPSWASKGKTLRDKVWSLGLGGV